MDGITLLLIFLFGLPAIGIASKIYRKYSEALILEEQLGKETYQWLLKSNLGGYNPTTRLRSKLKRQILINTTLSR
jgi:hypothetical protein